MTPDERLAKIAGQEFPMIPTPPSLTIARSKAGEKTLIDKCRKWLDSQDRAEGIHASDITTSPRISFWRKMKPSPLPDRLVQIFMVGRILHTLVFYAYDMKPLTPELDSDEGSLKAEHLGGLLYSTDKIIKENIVELKTTRKPNEPKDTSDLQIYVPQLLVYMAARKQTTAWLWVLYINLKDKSGTSPEFRAYKLTISKDELEKLQLHVRAAVGVFDKAVKTKDHTILPLCPAWMCSRSRCEFYDDCKPEGRWKPAKEKK